MKLVPPILQLAEHRPGFPGGIAGASLKPCPPQPGGCPRPAVSPAESPGPH